MLRSRIRRLAGRNREDTSGLEGGNGEEVQGRASAVDTLAATLMAPFQQAIARSRSACDTLRSQTQWSCGADETLAPANTTSQHNSSLETVVGASRKASRLLRRGQLSLVLRDLVNESSMAAFKGN